MGTAKVFHSAEGRRAVLQYYDMLLGRVRGPIETCTVSTRFGDTFALAAGDRGAPPMVLLHGSSMNAVMWANDMQVYAQRYRVYAPDLPGEPGKSAENQLPFDTPAYADWLLDVFDGLSIGRAVLMGISLGGWLSLKFSIAHPDRVCRLVLFCPAGVGAQNHAFMDIALPLLAQGEKGAEALVQRINGGAPIPDIMLGYQKLIGAAFHSRKEPIPLFSDAELASVSMPSLLYFGEEDIILNAKEAAGRYARLVPGAQVSLLPDRGHSLIGFAEEVMAWL